MKKLIESLEQIIKEMGLTIIEKHEDNFCTALAVRHDTKGVFVVYTTQVAISLNDFFAFNMYRIREHIPFDSIVCDNPSSFLSRYSDTVKDSGLLRSTYSSTFCPEEFRFFVNCAE